MADLRQRDANGPSEKSVPDSAIEEGASDTQAPDGGLPRHHSSRLPHGIHENGESNRSGIHPWRSLKIIFRSSCLVSKYVNVLWPIVPVAIAMSFAARDRFDLVFALNYVAMVPTANLIGFAGQELTRKLPKVFGVVLEAFIGSIVEIILFTVLIVEEGSMHGAEGESVSLIPVIQAAILGSILANLLLCLGACFIAGGLRNKTQKFDSAISEVGNGLLLMAAFGLSIPRAFLFSLDQVLPSDSGGNNDMQRAALTLKVSRSTAVILLAAFLIYIFFQMHSHHSLYDSIFEQDELRDRDRARDARKPKLTLTECLVALAVALACVSIHAIFLVRQIEPIIKQHGVSDLFMGLILVPLVEKLAEHLTAVDEAWDDQMNLALAHILGATLQTALFNSSLVVIIGWGLNKAMTLDFASYQVILLVLAILTVGNFLRDQESNYLEGSLCVLIYLLIAVTSFYYPNPGERAGAESEGAANSTHHGPEALVAHLIKGL